MVSHMAGPDAQDGFAAEVDAFRALTDRSHLASILARGTADGGAVVVTANPAAETLLRRRDLAGVPFAELVEPAGMTVYSEAVRRSVTGRIDVAARIRRYRRGDGSTVLLNGLSLALHRGDYGSLTVVVLVPPQRAYWGRRLLEDQLEVTSALAEIRALLLRGDEISDVLTLVCDGVLDLMEADSCGLLRVDESRVVLVAGDSATARPAGTTWPLPAGPFGELLLAGGATRASTAGDALRDERGERLMPEMSGADIHMAVAPVQADGRANFGALAVRRRRAAFTEGDLGVLEAFAEGVAETLVVAEGRAELERLRVLEVRQGIARDLHDEVIQDLIGLRLQLVGLVPTVDDPALARSLEDVRDELNRTTMRLRDVVAGLQEEPAGHLEDAVQALAGSRAERQGLEWTVVVDGPVDELPGDARSEILRVLNESVSNVLRHADASRLDVRLGVSDGRVELTVRDDGIGPAGTARSDGMGLRNLRVRARDRGGECRLASAAAGGSVLTWWVPAPAPESSPPVPPTPDPGPPRGRT